MERKKKMWEERKIEERKIKSAESELAKNDRRGMGLS